MNAIEKGLMQIDTNADNITEALSSVITNRFNAILEQTAKAYAIEELEKAINEIERWQDPFEIADNISTRIKELKGEQDDER